MGGEDAVGPPTACLVLPTLDRGAKLVGGKVGYERNMASKYLPSTTSIFGFFANGVLGNLDGTVATGPTTIGGGGGVNDNMLHGSSSQYVIFAARLNDRSTPPVRPRPRPRKPLPSGRRRTSRRGSSMPRTKGALERPRNSLPSMAFDPRPWLAAAPRDPRTVSSPCDVAKFTPVARFRSRPSSGAWPRRRPSRLRPWRGTCGRRKRRAIA